MTRQFCGLAGLAWLCLCVGISSRADTSYQDWQFTNNDNPALPTVVTNTAGAPTATIVVVDAGIGWIGNLPGFGTQTGLWDLGSTNGVDPTQRGQVLLNIPNPIPATGNSYTDLGLRVVQWVDGFPYAGDLTFSIPGAVYVGRTVVEVPGGLGGKWVEDQYQWHLTPSPATVSLTITGAVGGTLLDRIRVDTLAPGATTPVTIVSGITPDVKVYDGTDTATISSNSVVLAGVRPADAGLVALSTNGYIATFASASAGPSNEVSVVGLSLTGPMAPNYSLVQPTKLTAAIAPAPVTVVSGLFANDKAYDGTTAATIRATLPVLTGLLPADVIQVSLATNGYVAAFASPGAGSNLPVLVTGLSLAGPGSENYAVAPLTLSANITPAESIVTAWPTASAITYGQTLAASTLSGGSGTPPGRFVFTLPSTIPNIGTSTQSVTYIPLDTVDYKTVIGSVSVTVNLGALTVAGVTADSKAYDGTTNATLVVSNAVLVGVASGDTVTLDTTNAVGAFMDKDTGTNKLVIVSGLTLLGADVSKYTLTQPTTNADITPASLTVTGITASDKVYDGTTNATITVSNAALHGVISGDDVILSTAGASGAFTDPDAGTNKTVLVSGLSLSGADATNYLLLPPLLTASITPANSATVLFSSQNPSLQGSNVTFTATVTPAPFAATTLGGNVQFYTNGVALGSPMAITNGVARLSTADLPVGTNSVTASYLGGGNFLGSSNSLEQVVQTIPSTPVTIVIQATSNGTVTLTFTGTPGAQYVVQASDSLAIPAWVNISTNTAAADGHWSVTESTNGHPMRFYRSRTP